VSTHLQLNEHVCSAFSTMPRCLIGFQYNAPLFVRVSVQCPVVCSAFSTMLRCLIGFQYNAPLFDRLSVQCPVVCSAFSTMPRCLFGFQYNAPLFLLNIIIIIIIVLNHQSWQTLSPFPALHRELTFSTIVSYI